MNVDEFGAALARFDAVRLDHFIGFVRTWEIPAEEPTAIRGCWRMGPGAHLFLTLQQQLGELPRGDEAQDACFVQRRVELARCGSGQVE